MSQVCAVSAVVDGECDLPSPKVSDMNFITVVTPKLVNQLSCEIACYGIHVNLSI